MILAILRLVKYKLSLAVTLTCLSAYIIHSKNADFFFLLTGIAVFILACGFSVLNQYQERRSDSIMQRTVSRPLPQGIISPATALIISILLIITGLILLFPLSLTAFFSGILALFLYNGIYTRLKPVSYLAIIPGALVGSIPPVIGWTASGGSLTDPASLYLAFLIFMWQIPHFWILVIKYREDYSAAGYPTVLRNLDEYQVKVISFIWISLACLLAITWPLFGIDVGRVFTYIIIISTLLFIIAFCYFVFRLKNLDSAFTLSNIFITFLFVSFALG